jgi:hypothetical protein
VQELFNNASQVQPMIAVNQILTSLTMLPIQFQVEQVEMDLLSIQIPLNHPTTNVTKFQVMLLINVQMQVFSLTFHLVL